MGKFLFITTKGDWGGSEPLWCEAAERAVAELCRAQVAGGVGSLEEKAEMLKSGKRKLGLRPIADY